MPEFDGRVAVITGSSHGIGRAIATQLANNGAVAVLADLAEEAGRALESDLDDRGLAARFVRVDVADTASVEDLFATIDREYGAIDVLVNNAAIAHGPDQQLHTFLTTDSKARSMIEVNLYGAWLCSRAAAWRMSAAESGAIVNISSVGAKLAHRDMAVYDATKGALESLTRSMALDLAPWGIRVNAVGPGPTAVERWPPSVEGKQWTLADVIPMGRMGQPEDVARAVAFLASSEAAFITGQVLYVDGGLSVQQRPWPMDVQPTFTPEDRVLKTSLE